jgi:hypothetical protein
VSAIHLVYDYPHPPEKVWRVLTDPAFMQRWAQNGRPEGFSTTIGTRFQLIGKPQTWSRRSQKSVFRPGGIGMARNPSPAKDLLKEVVAQAITSPLKVAGFRKNALNYHRRRGETVQVVNIQLSHGSTAMENVLRQCWNRL